MLHFSNSKTSDLNTYRMRKLTPILNILKENFQKVMVPGKNICADETLVPFRGKLGFKQYIKNMQHKFGIKLFKLCTEGGYTYNW